MANSVNGLGWIAVALVIFAVWNPARAVYGAYIFGAFMVLKYYFPKNLGFTVPESFFDMLPYLVTALVLIITSVKKSRERSQPQSCGINYFREER